MVSGFLIYFLYGIQNSVEGKLRSMTLNQLNQNGHIQNEATFASKDINSISLVNNEGDFNTKF